jgi:hypothetical protein
VAARDSERARRPFFEKWRRSADAERTLQGSAAQLDFWNETVRKVPHSSYLQIISGYASYINTYNNLLQ